ncbi:hypothetical protein POTOM_055454 [Populus tomentosa]|uniref:glutathione transferase n=1 Tax=Populus tomentosa TaxID=118781 RepID=A0A8X7Y0J4_POPTO|nr:hypothetical protein POTOM_055454 [Populus tomentosa]
MQSKDMSGAPKKSPLACLLKKGVEFDHEHVDLDSGEQKLPEFLLKQVERKLVQEYLYMLSKSKYFAGDNFRLADLSRLPATRYQASEAGLGHLMKEKRESECLVAGRHFKQACMEEID